MTFKVFVVFKESMMFEELVIFEAENAGTDGGFTVADGAMEAVDEGMVKAAAEAHSWRVSPLNSYG